MKFIVDNQWPVALADWRVASGWDAVHELELQLNTSPHTEIWNYAKTNKLVVISKDEDFSHRASFTSHVQVVWVRLGNCRNKALLSAFEKQMSTIAAALKTGASVIELWPSADE